MTCTCPPDPNRRSHRRDCPAVCCTVCSAPLIPDLGVCPRCWSEQLQALQQVAREAVRLLQAPHTNAHARQRLIDALRAAGFTVFGR